MPHPDALTLPDFDHYVQTRFQHPDLLPDGYLVALDGDECVGLTKLWRSQANDDLYTGLTGVRRTHRRRGIALALKLRAIRFAQERGSSEIKTWNEVANEGMLAINVRLGFVRQPAWVVVTKILKDEDEETENPA